MGGTIGPPAGVSAALALVSSVLSHVWLAAKMHWCLRQARRCCQHLAAAHACIGVHQCAAAVGLCECSETATHSPVSPACLFVVGRGSAVPVSSVIFGVLAFCGLQMLARAHVPAVSTILVLASTLSTCADTCASTCTRASTTTTGK